MECRLRARERSTVCHTPPQLSSQGGATITCEFRHTISAPGVACSRRFTKITHATTITPARAIPSTNPAMIAFSPVNKPPVPRPTPSVTKAGGREKLGGPKDRIEHPSATMDRWSRVDPAPKTSQKVRANSRVGWSCSRLLGSNARRASHIARVTDLILTAAWQYKCSEWWPQRPVGHIDPKEDHSRYRRRSRAQDGGQSPWLHSRRHAERKSTVRSLQIRTRDGSIQICTTHHRRGNAETQSRRHFSTHLDTGSQLSHVQFRPSPAHTACKTPSSPPMPRPTLLAAIPREHVTFAWSVSMSCLDTVRKNILPITCSCSQDLLSPCLSTKRSRSRKRAPTKKRKTSAHADPLSAQSTTARPFGIPLQSAHVDPSPLRPKGGQT